MRTPKAVSGVVSYGDLFVAGVVKYFEERMLAGTFVGNGTIKSGAIKLGAGLLMRKFMPKGVLADGVGLAFGVDGVEDILTGFMGGGGLGAGAQASNW